MVYTWIKETGLAHLSKSSFCLGAALGCKHPVGEKDVADTPAHTVNIHTWTRGRCHASEPRPRGKALPFLVGLSGHPWNPCHGCAYISNTYSRGGFLYSYKTSLFSKRSEGQKS